MKKEKIFSVLIVVIILGIGGIYYWQVPHSSDTFVQVF